MISKILKKAPYFKNESKYMIKEILVKELNYTWKKAPVQTIKEISDEIKYEREVFKRFIRYSIIKSCEFIFIDECTFSLSNLS